MIRWRYQAVNNPQSTRCHNKKEAMIIKKTVKRFAKDLRPIEFEIIDTRIASNEMV
jgi:hypothetical protein